MRCSEPGVGVAVAIAASHAPGRWAWVVRGRHGDTVLKTPPLNRARRLLPSAIVPVLLGVESHRGLLGRRFLALSAYRVGRPKGASTSIHAPAANGYAAAEERTR